MNRTDVLRHIASLRNGAPMIISPGLANYPIAEAKDEPVGAADDGVLLVRDDRDLCEARGGRRRDGRIPAKADDDRRPDIFQKLARQADAVQQRAHPAKHSKRRAQGERRGRNAVQLSRGYAFDQLADARIGRDVRGPAATVQHLAQRERGEKMAAGAAGDEERPPSQSSLDYPLAASDWRGPIVTRASA